MPKRFLTFCVMAALAITAQTQAESVLYFHTSPGDKELSEISSKRAETLRACGFSVAENKDFDAAKWESFIQENKNTKPSMVFIDGHGIALSTRRSRAGDPKEATDPTFFLTRDPDAFAVDMRAKGGPSIAVPPTQKQIDLKRAEELKKKLADVESSTKLRPDMTESERIEAINPTKLIRGDLLVGAIEKNFPNSNLFLDTCHSGACMKCSSIGVGTACAINEISYFESRLTDDIIELMCDSGPKGNCEKFSKADGNGNGVIDSDELSTWWGKKYNSNEPSVRELKSELPPDQISAKLSDTESAELQSVEPAHAIGVRVGNVQTLLSEDTELKKFRPSALSDVSFMPLSAQMQSRYPLPKNPSPEAIRAWELKVLGDTDTKALGITSVFYVPPVYTYEVRGGLKLKPFSSEMQKKLADQKGREKTNQTVAPRLQDFELRGLRCARGEQHKRKTQEGH